MNAVFHAIELTSGERVTVRIEGRSIAGEQQTYYQVCEDGRSFTRGEFWRLFRELDECAADHKETLLD